MSTKKNLCYVIVALIFFAVFSMGSGCGDTKYYNNDSGSSSKTSGGSSSGTTDDETATDDDSSSAEGDAIAAKIDGTWEIMDGTYRIIYDEDSTLGELAGKEITGHYVPGNIRNFQLKLDKNTDYWTDFYSITLTGDNILNSGLRGGNGMVLDFAYDNPPNEYATDVLVPVTFYSSRFYRFVGNNTYETTEKDYDSVFGMQSNNGYYNNTVTLVNNSTLKWSYSWKNNPNAYGQTVGQLIGTSATYQEITLRRLK